MTFKFGSSVKGLSSTGVDLDRQEGASSTRRGFKFSKPKKDGILIGKQDSKRIELSPDDRAHHTHIIGSTGTGKSKFIELLVRHDLENPDVGMCLLDPHGSLYEDVLHYVAHEKPELADRLVLFDPAGETENVIGFNPVVADGEHLDYQLDSLISACLKAWGQDSTDRTPRITKWLENIFYTIMCNDLTLVESAPLLSIQNKDHRSILLRNVHNDMVLDDWRMFETSSNTQKQALIEGAANRLRKFLRNEIIRNIIGQKERVLDFSEVMQQGKIVLVNLNGRGAISHENAKLLGILLVNEVFRCAKMRDPRDTSLKPFYFYIDEFAQFITRDIARALEEARKFKLFMVLAHQHLAQLRDDDEYLYASVLTNCKSKVVFGGLSREDAQIMADEVASGFVNLKAVKDEIFTTKSRQRLEKRTARNWSRGSSEGESVTNTEGHSYGSAHTNSETVGETYSESQGQNIGFHEQQRNAGEVLTRRVLGMPDPASNWGESRQQSYGRSRQLGQSQTHSSSHSHSISTGTNRSRSASQGESETWVSVNDEYQELSSRTFWSLQELEYMQMAQLKNQETAEAFVKLSGEEPHHIKVSRVDAAPFDTSSVAKIDAVRHRAITANGSYYTAINQVQEERTARQVAAFGEPLRFDAMMIDTTILEEDGGGTLENDDPFT